MSFGGSHWCRSTPDHEHRSTVPSPNRSIGSPGHRSMTPMESTTSYNTVRILTHEEFAAKHPHPPNPDNLTSSIDRQPTSSIDRRVPITYRVKMPKIDVARLNALRPKPKPSDNPQRPSGYLQMMEKIRWKSIGCMTNRHTRGSTQGELISLTNQELASLERTNRQQRPNTTTMDNFGTPEQIAASMQQMQQQMQQTIAAQQLACSTSCTA
ncbi:hypothetical protein DY000_02021361 [Brassica cretica]|uniref:DUF4005 domain-containing protein n=1 Tax=Brassica cretica TaxID=69181 RepID=A0ABQ7EC17_BRACR|nr:hypothetical protein DY000_02021361 [Brassica cretica]